MPRPLRAHGFRTTGGYHWCAGCQGSGRATCRTWGRKGWTTSYGRCAMCRGKGGRFQNHDARGRGSLGRMR